MVSAASRAVDSLHAAGAESSGRPRVFPECAHSPARACGFWRSSESSASHSPVLTFESSGRPVVRHRCHALCLAAMKFGSGTHLERRLFTLGELWVKCRQPGEYPSRERPGPAAILGVGLPGAPALVRHSGCQEAGVPLAPAAVSRATGEEVEIGQVTMPRSSPISPSVALFP